MNYELEMTKANRLKLAKAFQKNKRVDYSIDCVIEGQMGKAFVDNLTHPMAYCITIGPFWYFAGEAHSIGGYQLMRNFPAYSLFMPSPTDWLEAAKEIFGQHLQPFTRYSFSSTRLTTWHLEDILNKSPYQERLIPLDVELTTQLVKRSESYLELADFDSVQDFIERGLGFTIPDHHQVM